MRNPHTFPEPLTIDRLSGFPPPASWWSLDHGAILFRGEEHPEMVYLGLEGGFVNPLEHRDQRGRRLVEALTALPVAQIRERLVEYWISRRRRPSLRRAQASLHRLARPLVAFVAEFGPVGVGWGAEFPIGADGDDLVIVDLSGLGPVRFGRGRVHRRRTVPKGTDIWSQLERDETVRSDDLASLVEEQGDLFAALRLAEALLTQAAEARIRALTMAAVRGTPGHVQRLDLGPSSPWHGALRRRYPEGAELRPFGDEWDAPYIIWPRYGRLALAEVISRQLNWLNLRAEVDDRGSWRRSVRPTSLLQFAYLQLLDHLQKRSAFGIGWCPVCGGVILRTRRRPATRNRMHAGCGDVERKAAARGVSRR